MRRRDTSRSISTLLVPSSLIVVFVATWTAKFLGYSSRRITYNDNCRLLPDVSPGSEDIAVVDANLALVSSGDLDRISFKSGNVPREGRIYAVKFRSGGGGRGREDSEGEGDSEEEDSEVTTEVVPLLNMPTSDRIAFHPHGISYSNITDRLYDVSHDCGAGRTASESIEVFRLVRRDGDSDNPDKKKQLVALEHEISIRSDEFFHLGGLNDVVEGAALGELFVTVFTSRPFHEHCRGGGHWTNEVGGVIDALFRRKSKVLRCVWHPNPHRLAQDRRGWEGGVSCSVAAGGFSAANGIATDPKRERVFVVDGTERTLNVFDRMKKETDGGGDDDDYGTLLSPRDVVDLSPYTLDNVEYDVSSGKLTLSASPRLYEVIRRIEGDRSVEVSGGMITVELPLSGEGEDSDGEDVGGRRSKEGSYRVKEVLMHDGSKLSMISSAVFFGNGHVLLGSPPSDGVLICPVPSSKGIGGGKS